MVLVVVFLLQKELLVGKIDGEGTDGDTKAWECILVTVEPRELALVSPSVSFSPRIVRHC